MKKKRADWELGVEISGLIKPSSITQREDIKKSANGDSLDSRLSTVDSRKK